MVIYLVHPPVLLVAGAAGAFSSAREVRAFRELTRGEARGTRTRAIERGAVKRYTSRSRAWRAQSIKTTPLPFSPSFCELRPQQMGRTNKLGTRRGKAALESAPAAPATRRAGVSEVYDHSSVNGEIIMKFNRESLYYIFLF